MNKFFFDFLKVMAYGKTSKKFVIGVCLSFSFSIAVILSTVGIMDGFDLALKEGLQKSNGDILLYSRHGFFELEKEDQELFERLDLNFSPFVQTEAFLMRESFSRGVLLKGVEAKSFAAVTGINIEAKERGLYLGPSVVPEKLEIGDNLVLTMATGQKEIKGLPSLKLFNYQGIVNHGVHKKDTRFTYTDIKGLQEILQLDNRINLVSLALKEKFPMKIRTQLIEEKIEALEEELPTHYVIRPFWREFAPLLEAVAVEKLSITIVLQIVVVISIFNILAFMIFLNEKRAQDIFLFQALGVSKKQLGWVWIWLNVVLWIVSCVGGLILTEIFRFLLKNINYLKLPGDVYGLTEIDLFIEPQTYILVFSLALLWLCLITYVGIYRIRKKSILSGLRKEFA